MASGSRLALLSQVISSCTKCSSLVEGRLLTVPGEGNPNADLMIVGEAPGKNEAETGRPFVGLAGQLLTNTLSALKIKRQDVFIANALKCRPPKNRTPTWQECENCSPFLNLQIKVIKPKVILCLGAVAVRAILHIDAPIDTLRGKIYHHKVDELAIKVVVSYHPSFLLRTPAKKVDAWQDMQFMLGVLDDKENN